MAGRAWQANLFPLVSAEIPDFILQRYLRFGWLPHVYTSDYPEKELDAYINTYLREEIQAEALVQNLPKFSRFLKRAAISNAEQIRGPLITLNWGYQRSLGVYLFPYQSISKHPLHYCKLLKTAVFSSLYKLFKYCQ